MHAVENFADVKTEEWLKVEDIPFTASYFEIISRISEKGNMIKTFYYQLVLE